MTQAIQQHFLPRFLMAGFASRRQGRKAYSYAFRIGSPPFNTNIENIGGERYFYAKTGDILQERDDQDAKLLGAIREKKAIPSGSEPAIAEFAASLVVRTKNVRQRAIELVEAALEDIRRTVRQPTWLDEFTRPLVEAECQKQLGDHAPRWIRRKFHQEQRKRVRKVPEQFDALMTKVSFPIAARDGQVRALEAGPATAMQAYRELGWTVSSSLSIPLILGDIGPVWQAEEANRFTVPLLSLNEGRGRLLLPISTDLLLVGSSPGVALEGVVDAAQLNRASARQSMEFFISAQNTEREGQYHAIIGMDRDDWIQRAVEQGLLDS
jgi:hypothetical protein